MGKWVNYSCRQLKWVVHWSLASEHFQFQDRSFATTLDEFARYCSFIKRGPAWLKILSISVNPHCVYQHDLIRVRCPERVWLLAYGISQRPVHAWGWPNPKTHAKKVFVANNTITLYWNMSTHTRFPWATFNWENYEGNYLKSEMLENGDNYNLCWIASWLQLFRQTK